MEGSKKGKDRDQRCRKHHQGDGELSLKPERSRRGIQNLKYIQYYSKDGGRSCSSGFDLSATKWVRKIKGRYQGSPPGSPPHRAELQGQLWALRLAALLPPAAPVPPLCSASLGQPGQLLTPTTQRPRKPFTKKSVNMKWKIQEGQLNWSWIFNNREDGENNQINYLFQIITQFHLQFITDSD